MILSGCSFEEKAVCCRHSNKHSIVKSTVSLWKILKGELVLAGMMRVNRLQSKKIWQSFFNTAVDIRVA
jgi:hypothetical protein